MRAQECHAINRQPLVAGSRRCWRSCKWAILDLCGLQLSCTYLRWRCAAWLGDLTVLWEHTIMRCGISSALQGSSMRDVRHGEPFQPRLGDGHSVPGVPVCEPQDGAQVLSVQHDSSVVRRRRSCRGRFRSWCFQWCWRRGGRWRCSGVAQHAGQPGCGWQPGSVTDVCAIHASPQLGPGGRAERWARHGCDAHGLQCSAGCRNARLFGVTHDVCNARLAGRRWPSAWERSVRRLPCSRNGKRARALGRAHPIRLWARGHPAWTRRHACWPNAWRSQLLCGGHGHSNAHSERPHGHRTRHRSTTNVDEEVRLQSLYSTICHCATVWTPLETLPRTRRPQP